jgi:hypothetical protein
MYAQKRTKSVRLLATTTPQQPTVKSLLDRNYLVISHNKEDPDEDVIVLVVALSATAAGLHFEMNLVIINFN